MKVSVVCVSAILLVTQNCFSQDEQLSEAKVIGRISDGKPSPPLAPKVLPKYKIHWQKIHQKKDHRVIINRVQAPVHLVQQPEKQLSSSEIEARHEAIRKWISEMKESGGMFTVSATIYDRKTTYVRWWHEGQEYTAYSNVDWNFLGGFHEFEGRGKRYTMMLFSGNATTEQLEKEIQAGYRIAMPQLPKLPDLRTQGASYMMVKGDEKNDDAMEFIEAIHDLYESEKIPLKTAWRERIKNKKIRELKEKELRENPPPKKDIIINFWEIKNRDQTNRKESK